MRNFDEIDRTILDISRQLFFDQGIRKTEMKDIALKCGIGRSTLYRRFESKDVIAFYIANEILADLSVATDSVLSDAGALSGLEKFKKFAHSYANTLMTHPLEVRFLDEFDQIFTDEYPAEVGEISFTSSHSPKNRFLIDIMEEGKKDGSMNYTETADYMAWLFTNMIMGIAQRVLPREKHYIEEQGYGKEFVSSAVEIFINSIR